MEKKSGTVKISRKQQGLYRIDEVSILEFENTLFHYHSHYQHYQQDEREL